MFKKLKFQNFFLYKPKVHKDKRGNFRRHFCKQDFKKVGLKINIAQGNVSESYKKGTLRGFHFKSGKSKETKILSCLRGSIYHVAIDLRKNSKTYLKSFSIILEAKSFESIIVPPNCANAILTLRDNTILHYYMGDYFENDKYSGIRYDDPFFKIKWPFKPKIVNDRDRNYQDFKLNK
jgi:dTDP-4-dehydrorhamnose 3,5-epimerase